MTKRGALILGTALMLAWGPTSALGLTISVIDQGLNAPSTNGGCVSGVSPCLSNEVFDLNPVGFASGTIEVPGDGFVTASVDLTVPFVTFSGSSGGVTGVTFENLHYTGTASVIATGDPASFYQLIFSVPGPGTITGDYSSNLDPSGPLGPASAQVTALSCTIFASFGQCDVGFEAFTISLDGVSHDFVHTLTLTVDPPIPAPEPGAGLLALLLLAGFGVRARLQP